MSRRDQRLQILLTKSEFDDLEILADHESRTMSSICRMILKQHIDFHRDFIRQTRRRKFIEDAEE